MPDPIDQHLNSLFESVSRLNSGANTPARFPVPVNGDRDAGTALHASVSAEDLIARLVGGPTPVRTHTPTRVTRSGVGSLLLPVAGKTTDQTLITVAQATLRPEPIDLELYNFQGYPVPLPSGSGYLLRFVLLDWDDVRLDRLLLSLKRSLPDGAEARISRLLLHDGDWVWRLQVTLYLGPYLGWTEQAFSASPLRKPVALIAAL